MHAVDLTATILAVAGVPIASLPKAIDGIDHWSEWLTLTTGTTEAHSLRDHVPINLI